MLSEICLVMKEVLSTKRRGKSLGIYGPTANVETILGLGPRSQTKIV